MSTSSNPTADELFQTELSKRNLPFAIINDGLYKIQIGDVTATINLENIRRNYKRDNDADAIARFAGKLETNAFNGIQNWEAVKSLVRFSIEPSDYESGFDNLLYETVTENLVKIFVFTSPDGSRISWITLSMCKQRCQESLIDEYVCASLHKCLDQNEPTKPTAYTTL
jgi:hypothetical protein